MRVAVYGLWHLGPVTAACLASAGHSVVAIDESAPVVDGLSRGVCPVFEPGLSELVLACLAAGNLRFTSNLASGLAHCDILWVTYDTPVDDNDVADVEFVIGQTEKALRHAAQNCLVVVSSQLPVGSISQLEAIAQKLDRPDLAFVCSPENLRLGKAIQVFSKPDRIVAGVRREADALRFKQLMAPISSDVLVMRVESAEMTKHAINSFLATSVSFANEIAAICEVSGADANEVARGLKSDSRIGPGAYLGPGGPFAGGTLARDIGFLSDRARQTGVELSVIPAVAVSNDRHRGWALARLHALLGELDGLPIAILGLTYKPGTDTLRRSSAIELARALKAAGADVSAYDPMVAALPPDIDFDLVLAASAAEAVVDAAAVVIGTDWPGLKTLDWHTMIGHMARPVVIDANGFLAAVLESEAGVTYASVGRVIDRSRSPTP